MNLRVVDLLLGERRVSGELVDGDAEGLEAVAEVEHHPLHERLHRGHVDDLESVEVDLSRGLVLVHADLVEHAQHGHVSLARAGGRVDEHVLGGEHRARDCTQLSDLVPPKAGWAHSGISAMVTSFPLSSKGAWP